METKQNRKAHRLVRYILEGLSYMSAAASVFYVILVFKGKHFSGNLIGFLAFAAAFFIFRAIVKSYYDTKKKQRDALYRFFFSGLKYIVIIMLLMGIWGVYEIIAISDCGTCAIYQAVGVGMVVIWACIFVSYFVWALYFYNVNLGLTEDEWDKIYKARDQKARGENYNVDDLNAEPEYNPYKDETFGLPPGTVRGMIAFTLLFGAIAVLIVSIGMRNRLDENVVFWDQYEFFKTAFLMMIAFYFGSRSLQYLQNRNNQPVVPGKPDHDDGATPSATGVMNEDENEQNGNIPPVDPMAKPEKPGKTEVAATAKTAVFDPMKPNV